MKYISVSLILTLVFTVYIVNTIWTLVEIFIPPECSRGERCLSSYLATNPKLNLVLYTSVKKQPYLGGHSSDSVTKVYIKQNFDYRNPVEFNIALRVPRETRRNGTFYMHALLLDDNKLYKDFDELIRTESMHTFPLVTHVEPQAATFNLLQQNSENEKPKPKKKVFPYAHISTQVPLAVLGDNLNLPTNKLPGELHHVIRIRNGKFLPIIMHNTLKARMSNLQLLNTSTSEVNITMSVAPASYGIFRMALHMSQALTQLRELGFSEKDVDDVKGIFADTNLYLLSATVAVAGVHLLFDFLAFKNEISFWRRKRSLAGLSARTVLWCAFSQLVIFLYLLDENASMLVLVPVGISTVIEMWKITKVLHLRISFTGWKPRIWRDRSLDAEEKKTAGFDAEAMHYLSMLLYPLCVAGAIYSLIYEPHKSWYSWAIHSIVNCVYAFGFLLMLPQLFVNYRLRSVAALPWQAFMYKAFNTFIDDVFAFIISMPTAHRVACFRDDLVFLVYLYQRWLYPVDKSRVDTGASMSETAEIEVSEQSEPVKSKDD